MGELTQVMGLLGSKFPACPYMVPYPEAKWFGKYAVHGACPASVKAQLPFETMEAACAALEAAGWVRRFPEPASGPHYDRP